MTEKEISHGDILLQAKPIGGFRMLDINEADDKIIAVLKDDAVYGSYNDTFPMLLKL
ncbi:MAG: inorganic diphosphatase [Saprospiraceae bacterium]